MNEFEFDLQRFDEDEDGEGDEGEGSSVTGNGTEESPWVVTTEDALKAKLTSGGYIKLGADITYSDCTTISKDVTLDLAGQTLTCTNKYNPFDVGANFTVKNTTTDATKGKITGSTPWGFFYTTKAGVNITIEGGNLDYSGARYAVYDTCGGNNIDVQHQK